MEYRIHNYVFISVKSPVPVATQTCFCYLKMSIITYREVEPPLPHESTMLLQPSPERTNQTLAPERTFHVFVFLDAITPSSLALFQMRECSASCFF